MTQFEYNARLRQGISKGTKLIAASFALCLSSFDGKGAVIKADFEANEGFQIEASVAGIGGWKGSRKVAKISRDEAAHGLQSCMINPVSGAVLLDIPAWLQSGAFFVDLEIKPMPQSEETAIPVLQVGGADLAFFVGDSGEILLGVPMGPAENDPVELIRTSAWTNDDGLADRWIRLTFRMEGETWDLFVDGELVAVDLRRIPNRHLAINGSPSTVTFLDSVSIDGGNPLFRDVNRDSIPDAYEVAMGMNPSPNNRAADRNLDSQTNIQEYLENPIPTMGRVTGRQGMGGKFIFVDSVSGDDLFLGSAPTRYNGDGPKASIRAAMQVATEGSVIVISEGVYHEGSISLAGKPITLKTVGNVKLN